MKNNFSWLDLKAMIQPDACPVCAMVEKRTEQKIAAFQYEHVSDVEFRRDFIESDGFCAHHTERFFHQGDPLNHAILYHHLFSVKRKRLEQNRSSKRHNVRDCLLCAHEKVSDKLYVNLFPEALAQPQFLELYRQKGVVCTTHFDAIRKRLQKKKSPHLNAFITITLAKYASYEHDLAEIKRKNNHKHADERLNANERKTWKIARKLLIDQGMHRKK